VILAAATDVAQTMFAERCVQQLRNISLSNNTVSPRFADISEDSEERLIEKVRNKRFSIQMGEVTDCCDIGHLTDCVRYVEDTTINEYVLF
jgi:hypothetical protein